MKTLALVAALLCAPKSHAAVRVPDADWPRFTIGGLLAYPDIVGAFASVFPVSVVSLDAKLTLESVSGGATAHIPLGSDTWQNSFLVAMQVGYQHGLVHPGMARIGGTRVQPSIGYGILGPIDIRLLLGPVWFPRSQADPLGAGFGGELWVGHHF